MTDVRTDFKSAPTPGGMGRPKGKRTRRFRHKANTDEWTELRALKLDGQLCRVCAAVLGESLHHVVARSQGGSDVADNLVPVCGDGTRGCHGLLEAHDVTACQLLAASLNDFEYAHAVSTMGMAWLERRYHLFGVLSEVDPHREASAPTALPLPLDSGAGNTAGGMNGGSGSPSLNTRDSPSETAANASVVERRRHDEC